MPCARVGPGHILQHCSQYRTQYLSRDIATRNISHKIVDVASKFIPFTNGVRGPYCKLRTEGKKQGSVTYSTDRENEVSKIFYLLCAWRVWERFLYTRNGFKYLAHLESKTSQFKIVLIRNLKQTKSFKLLFGIKSRTPGDKLVNSLATKTALDFSGPYSPAWPANRSVRTNWEIQ